MISLTDYLLEHPWIPLLFVAAWAAVFAGVISVFRRAHLAGYLRLRQYDVLSESDVARALEQIDEEQKPRFQLLVRVVRSSTGGVVRLGHIWWILRELERGDGEPTRPPALRPPKNIRPDVRHDPGAFFFRQFMFHKANGRLMQAYEQLYAGVKAKSPVCTAALSVAQIRGDIPGRDADPSAVEQLNEAIASGFGYADLGFLLLDGVHLPRDVPRAIAMFEQAVERGWDGIELELATIFYSGEHVPQDMARATGYLLATAPAWRRKAARMGFSQEAWAREQLEVYAKVRAEVAAMPGWKSQKIAKAMVEQMLAVQ